MIDQREALLENVKIKAHNVYSTYETVFNSDISIGEYIINVQMY